MYRTYDSAWNRTGYAAVPQYPGQADLAEDYPPRCPCGAGMASWSVFAVARCANGHEMKKEKVNG